MLGVHGVQQIVKFIDIVKPVGSYDSKNAVWTSKSDGKHTRKEFLKILSNFHNMSTM